MGTQPIDYAAILADLEAKKSALDSAIASVRIAMAAGSLGQSSDGAGFAPAASNGINGEVPAGAFFGKSIPDATKLFLEIVKKKQTSKDIATALLKGGMETASKDFPSIVHSILDRARKGANPSFVKLGTQWGLAAWYPNFVPGAVKPTKKQPEKKSANPPTRKTASQGTGSKATSAPAQSTTAKPHNRNSPLGKEILGVLRSKPGTEFTAHEIAERLKVDVRKVNLFLGNFVRGGTVEKTTNGKYRAKSQEKAA